MYVSKLILLTSFFSPSSHSLDKLQNGETLNKMMIIITQDNRIT